MTGSSNTTDNKYPDQLEQKTKELQQLFFDFPVGFF